MRPTPDQIADAVEHLLFDASIREECAAKALRGELQHLGGKPCATSAGIYRRKAEALRACAAALEAMAAPAEPVRAAA